MPANDNCVLHATSALDLYCPRCAAYPGERCVVVDGPANYRATNTHGNHLERQQELYDKGDAHAGRAIARAIFERRTR